MPLSVTLLIVLILNGLFECASRTILLCSALKSRYRAATPIIARETNPLSPDLFVSAHIATYNEPPDLVIATLRSISLSDMPNYEVVVIDNNTEDPALWRPVEREVAKLGQRFRFFHLNNLSGAKAGALNVALAEMDGRATHVAVIDADYQVSPTFFSDALQAAVAGAVDYVQFPQSYRRVSVCARGVEQELGDYFACFAYGAGRPGSMLPTGTLSLFSARALRAVDGWGVSTITEDAELGVRLQAAGYRGLWRAERAGQGLLPVDFRGLSKQRARWAAGNMQVLRHVVIKRRMALSAMDFLNLIAQLTAWISFWGLPAAALALVAIFPSLPLAGPIGGVAGGTIVFSFLLTALRMAMLVDRQAGRWRINFAAFAAKLALTWTSAFAWLPSLVNTPLRFHRTPKASGGEMQNLLPHILLTSIVFGVLCFMCLIRGQIIEAVACGLLATIWGCARATDRHLRATAALNTIEGEPCAAG